MDSYEIARYMRLDEKIRDQFYGVYSLDVFPKKLPIPSLVIVNLDYSTDKGSHWVVLHRVNNEVVEHFDSAGKKPKRDIVNNLFSNDYHTNTIIRDCKIIRQIHVDYFVCIIAITVAEEEPCKVFYQIFQ